VSEFVFLERVEKPVRTPLVTVPITVKRTCSLTVKGPGFKETPKILTRGMNFAHARPMGNATS
jgi:hypothetical protein